MLNSPNLMFRPFVLDDAPAFVDAVRESVPTLALGRLEIVIGVGNLASLGAARKAGALEEGIARKRLRLGERFIDAHMLSLVR